MSCLYCIYIYITWLCLAFTVYIYIYVCVCVCVCGCVCVWVCVCKTWSCTFGEAYSVNVLEIRVLKEILRDGREKVTVN
jgi:hypothetical protein